MSKTANTLNYFEQLLLACSFKDAENQLDFIGKDKSNSVSSFELFYAKIRLLNKQGQYSENHTYFNHALELLDIINFNDDQNRIALLGIEKGIILHAIGQPKAAFQVLTKMATSIDETQNFELVCKVKLALGNWYLVENDFTHATQVVGDINRLLEKSKDDNINVTLLNCNLTGRIYIKKQEYDNALKYSKIAQKLAVKCGDIGEELIALNNIAISNVTQSQYQDAMEIFFDVLARSTAIAFRPLIARSLINIGSVYAQLFNFDEASKRYEEALSDYTDCLSSSTTVVLYNNIGNAAFSLLEYDKAIQSFQKCLNLALDTHYHEMIAHTYAQLSKTYIAKKQFKKAKKYADKAASLMKNLPDIGGIQINLVNLAQIAFFYKQYDLAIRYASKGIVLAKIKYDDFSKIRGYQLLADIHHAKGDFKAAYSFLLIHKAVQQEFSQLQYTRQVLDVEIKHVINEKQHEIERLQTENDLQAKLLMKQDELKKTNAQLVEVNGELRQFVYVASHDLKEPVRMISSYSKVLEERYGNLLDEKGLEYLGYVKSGAIRMNDLIDGLLKYSLIGKDEPAFKMIDMNDVMVICQSNLRLLINTSQAAFHIEKLPVVFGDFNLLVQLMQNLVTNAIKFVKKGEIPLITISSEKTDTNQIIHVKDNGIGINEYDQEDIFNIFKRLHTKSEYEGSGIGLAICLKIVQKMSGTIDVKSEEGKGTTFSIAFPLPS